MYFPHQTLDWHIYLRSLRYLWGSRERSPDYDEVRVGKQVWSVVWYIFRKDLPNRQTIQGPLFSSCSLDFQGQIYCLLAVDKFGPNSGWKILSLLKWREFCHLFQEVIDSLFLFCVSESTLPSGLWMYLDLHTVINIHTNESNRERNNFFLSSAAFMNLFSPCSVH